MYFIDIREHVIPLFIDADTLPVTFMYYKTTANLMHNINNNNSPPGTCHFHIKLKAGIHKNSLSRFGVKFWNEIPCHIRDLPKK